MNRIFGWINSIVNWVAFNPTLWVIGLLAVFAFIAFEVYAAIFPPLLQPVVYSGTRVLQTEWSDARRERYYQTSQGSLVVPYAWFQALELRTGTQMFASPEVQVTYGLLPDNDPKYNPDQMPVGIVKAVIAEKYKNSLGLGIKEWASLSCAACHTTQLLYKGTEIRIDGGQGNWRFEQWSQDLVSSLVATTSSPSKFARFCSRVYGHGDSGQCSEDEKKELWRQMKAYFDSALIMAAVNALINHTYVNKEGFCRTDALGRGVNGVFGSFDQRNIKSSSGPVSYPPLWYTHDYDWVQSPAAIRQPLGRNVTEAWGVNVRVQLTGPDRWGTTAALGDMFWMETLISTLRAPNWPEDLLGPIDRGRAERGRHWFNDEVWPNALPASEAELKPDPAALIGGPNPNRPTTGYCARCHAPALAPPNQHGKSYYQLPLYRMDVMGTDPDDADLFNARQVYTGPVKDAYDNQEVVGIGPALSVAVGSVVQKWFQEHSVSPACQTIMEGYRDTGYRAPVAYPARPLDGYWATGPYLHNGSVRTLYQLLSPVAERSKKFWIGSREFDPVELGFKDEQVQGAFLYDTSLAGNSNAGHEFRNAPPGTPGVIGPTLSRDQRLEIIEYLKVLASVQISQDELNFRNALLDAMAPFYEQWGAPGMYALPDEAGGWKMTDFCKAIENASNNKPAVSQASASPQPTAAGGTQQAK
ncbi:MAG TPA: di-heme-cytochrome C peroxidase [Blastocatellia bacterium]